MIVHGQMCDTLILVTFLVLSITLGKKNKPLQFAVFTKISLKMAQNINRASHLPHFSLKEWHSFILMQSGLLLLHIMHHYSEQVSYQQLQLLWRRLELSTGSFLFILLALFLQDFQHISFFVQLRIGYIARHCKIYIFLFLYLFLNWIENKVWL